MPRSFVVLVSLSAALHAAEIHVSPSGNDASPGTAAAPVRSFEAARLAAGKFAGKETVTVTFADGTYHLPETVTFRPRDSGSQSAPVIYQARNEGRAVISGGGKLELSWRPFRNGIYQAIVPAGFTTDQLFVNGTRQRMARYPDFDPAAQYFGGFSKDAFSKERAAKWSDPAGGFIHAMHVHLWGDYHYLITGKKPDGEVAYEGGWQNNRQMGMHASYRFVENIFEELDAPGEWFLNAKTHTLYFMPPAGTDLAKATVEAVKLRTLVEFQGDQKQPVHHIALKGFTFRHAARTFMDNKEPLLRSDWTTYRGGAILFNGAEDCAVEDSTLDQLGGTSVFVNNYNRRISIRGCLIAGGGAGGVSFVGDPAAVRSPLFEYNQVQDLASIDRTPGPKTENYPADCVVEDCLITRTGDVEKQTAPVQIEMSRRITVRDCTIHDVPRAGINIGSGCWGGHLIEGCDVFDTVKETGDHGSFNSWGRDRFWRPNIHETDKWIEEFPEMPLLDVVEKIVIRDSRWRCDHGWDIDLDDGSSNYHIYNNLCLNGGIKAREGFHRLIENNVIVRRNLDPHVWYAQCGDIFRHNIVWGNYGPARMHAPPWGMEMDRNLMHRGGRPKEPATSLQRQSGRDEHSIVADADFIDAPAGNYQVKPGSPALTLGFKNFPMDRFGVKKPSLKAMAGKPPLPGQPKRVTSMERDTTVRPWIGASVRNVAGDGEMSAYGVPANTGVLVLDIPAGSPLASSDLKKEDVILSLNGNAIDTADTLIHLTAGLTPGQTAALEIARSQKRQNFSLPVTADMPLMPEPSVVQAADGTILLAAATARIVGDSARLEGGGEKNIGHWKEAGDSVMWRVKVTRPGTYQVLLTYALAPDSTGSEIRLAAGIGTITAKPQVTGAWENYRTTEAGEIELAASQLDFQLTATDKPGEAVINLRKIELKPLR